LRPVLRDVAGMTNCDTAGAVIPINDAGSSISHMGRYGDRPYGEMELHAFRRAGHRTRRVPVGTAASINDAGFATGRHLIRVRGEVTSGSIGSPDIHVRAIGEWGRRLSAAAIP
jgi:hypothetical protein